MARTTRRIILFVASLSLETVYRKHGTAWFTMRKFLGRAGMVLIIIHIIISFLLFRPEIYNKFFAADGTINAIGEWHGRMPSISLVSVSVFIIGLIVFLLG